MRKLELGSVQIYLLDDGTLRYPAAPFFANVADAEWRAAAQADRDGRILVGHNCALIRTRRELVLVDTGYGADTHDGATGHLLEDFARTGFRRQQVSMVVTTHAHGDHFKGNTLVRHGERTATFPNACYHLAQADWEWFGGPGRAREFDDHIVALDRAGRLARVTPELRLTPEIVLLPTPGHTPGHTSVLVESAGRCAIFLGDLCHHRLHFAHADWVSRFDTHPSVTPATRRVVLGLAVARDALVVCPHALAPGVGRVVGTRTAFRWVALS